ncbi:putative glycoside hydrolase/deacetylase ChbG (UPF0249 family) [Streptomyces sp. B3I7]|uniref:ChbG/HpnK family deacetylase n=1 Tax=Streptomyces sp. B3I7 TaxID=3042269 RepID=UPI0027853D99|nr:ChbG/HpnK family deacetylase [Streptomyces sp. B3I7]MDQ0809504.1 putative glycoside hydrolase/deacetylase ChbG (UPF0249 family) [Streptomyces sp. B3I7]
MTARLLILNADDYGLSDGISRGVLRAHDTGLISSVSVLAVGPAVDRAVAGLRDRPGLGVGAHLAVVGEDPPLLTAREIPTLVDGHGAFKPGWRSFTTAAMAGRVDMADVRREFGAQLERLVRDLGLPLGHVDTHQHLHLYPPIGRIVAELATKWGIPAVRVPTSTAPGPRGIVVRHWSRSLATRLRSAGLDFPEGYGGLDEAGSLTLSRTQRLVERLARGPARTFEVNFHPGEPTASDRIRYAWGYQWEAELAGLTSAALRETLRRLDLRLGRFTDLPAADGGPARR